MSTTTHNTPARRRIVFWTVLAACVVLPIGISLTGNTSGSYLAAYISTALVIFGLIEALRRFRRREPIGRVWAVLIAGCITGIFVSIATVLGAGIYAGFLVGQILTVGLVLWMIDLVKAR